MPSIYPSLSWLGLNLPALLCAPVAAPEEAGALHEVVRFIEQRLDIKGDVHRLVETSELQKLLRAARARRFRLRGASSPLGRHSRASSTTRPNLPRDVDTDARFGKEVKSFSASTRRSFETKIIDGGQSPSDETNRQVMTQSGRGAATEAERSAGRLNGRFTAVGPWG